MTKEETEEAKRHNENIMNAMTLTEKMNSVSAAEFGVRIARAFIESRSSTTTFFIQQAFKDCEDDNGLMWEPFERMMERFIQEGLAAPEEKSKCE